MQKRHITARPVISEKTMTQATSGWYTFAVPLEVNKAQIAQEISESYKVNVRQVRTVRMPGKTRRKGRRMQPVEKPSWKKALVKLATGQTIDAFEAATKEATKGA